MNKDSAAVQATAVEHDLEAHSRSSSSCTVALSTESRALAESQSVIENVQFIACSF